MLIRTTKGLDVPVDGAPSQLIEAGATIRRVAFWAATTWAWNHACW